MILDSLRFWRREMHVDGFRFDLASLFTRDEAGRVNLEDPPIIAEITSDPEFQGVRLIAEAWDNAAYQLGRSFPGTDWLQWNARYRDDVRQVVRGDPGKIGALMTRLYGSDDIFPDQVTHAYHAYQSVNFVTSHDGFTLRDLVSYAVPRDAETSASLDASPQGSWNCGWEGDDGAPAEVLELRTRVTKLFWTLLLVSNGTPMFPAGDEMGRSQRGHANPYAEDNEISWIDWRLLEAHAGLVRFVRALVAFRRGPQVDLSPDSPGLAFFLRGVAEEDRDLYVMINRSADAVPFDIQDAGAGGWRRVLDTSAPAPDDIAEPGAEPPLASDHYLLSPRSAVVLVAGS
jgi:glycogen operon protein